MEIEAYSIYRMKNGMLNFVFDICDNKVRYLPCDSEGKTVATSKRHLADPTRFAQRVLHCHAQACDDIRRRWREESKVRRESREDKSQE